eukprot:2441920-Rhodomonas_salina.1
MVVACAEAFMSPALWTSKLASVRPFTSHAKATTNIFTSPSTLVAARARAATGVAGLSMLRDEYDLVVLGAGPTGLTAALKAANFGRSVLIVDATPKRQVQFTGPTGLCVPPALVSLS